MAWPALVRRAESRRPPREAGRLGGMRGGNVVRDDRRAPWAIGSGVELRAVALRVRTGSADHDPPPVMFAFVLERLVEVDGRGEPRGLHDAPRQRLHVDPGFNAHQPTP